MTLTISDGVAGDFQVLELQGDIDVESARQLRAHIVDRFSVPPAHVIVDLSGVDFMDSSGLGALVSGWHLTREAGAFRIAGANPRVQRVLSITGMEEVLAVFETVGEAAAG